MLYLVTTMVDLDSKHYHKTRPSLLLDSEAEAKELNNRHFNEGISHRLGVHAALIERYGIKGPFDSVDDMFRQLLAHLVMEYRPDMRPNKQGLGIPKDAPVADVCDAIIKKYVTGAVLLDTAREPIKRDELLLVFGVRLFLPHVEKNTGEESVRGAVRITCAAMGLGTDKYTIGKKRSLYNRITNGQSPEVIPMVDVLMHIAPDIDDKAHARELFKGMMDTLKDVRTL